MQRWSLPNKRTALSRAIHTIILGIFAIGLLYLDYHQYNLTAIRTPLTFLTEPIHSFAHAPTRLFSWAKSSLNTHHTLVTENTRLRAQQLLMQAQLQQMAALQSENKQLREIFKATEHASTRMMITELIGVDAEPNDQVIIINKGREEGVYVGQPIIDGGGIMGQVIQVDLHTARAMLLIDRRSAIPVQNSRNGLRGLARGTGAPEQLILWNVAETADVKVGDVFVSSGLGQRYPMGYPVAAVTQVQRNPNKAYAKVRMRIKAMVNRSRQLVLLWPENKEKT